MKSRILFITRNYPPKVGGLEEYSYNLIREFESHESTHKITLSKSIKYLIWFLPNITVPGNVEGFGIVALEAESCGLPVIASNIQGLRDAVISGKTGYLVGEGGVEGFLEKIESMNLEKDQIREIVNSKFNWSKISALKTRTVFLKPFTGSEFNVQGQGHRRQ